MRHDARYKTLGLVSDQVKEHPGQQRRRPIGLGMREGKKHRHGYERDPGELSEGNAVEIFRNEISQQKTAPEDFFDQRDDHDQTKKTHYDRRPIKPRLIGKYFRVETEVASRETEKRLWHDPNQKHDHRDEADEGKPLRAMPLILAPKPPDQSAAQNGLERVNPVLSRAKPKTVIDLLEQKVHDQQGHEQKHWQRISD